MQPSSNRIAIKFVAIKLPSKDRYWPKPAAQAICGKLTTTDP
jgi:hypothetical protein